MKFFGDGDYGATAQRKDGDKEMRLKISLHQNRLLILSPKGGSEKGVHMIHLL